MRRARLALLPSLLCACVSALPPPPEATLWRAPPEAAQPEQLRVEPRTVAVSLGTPVALRVRGGAAGEAVCSWPGGERGGPELSLPAAHQPGIVPVVCRNGGYEAWAQVTFTDAAQLPVSDPYEGGVVLVKTRRPPREPGGPQGRQSLGLPSLDALLQHLGAYALPAFPFDRSETEDWVGLDQWIALDLPTSVNFYQAVALLRACPDVYPESYLPDDGRFRRVVASGQWPVPLSRAGPRRAPLESFTATLASAEPPREAVSWDLQAIGVDLAWRRQDGEGIAIGVVDSGIDLNHMALATKLRTKDGEGGLEDADGNGLPGDEVGANFAHLAIAHGSGPPHLALGLVSNLSDWFGAGGEAPWGHGTVLAAIAAGAGGAGGRLGVAPRARLLAVDVQENHRVSASRLLDEDPRMRLAPEANPPASDALRSPVWSRAAGLAYAVAEGAHVVTCAWPAAEAHWLLHDALLFAEDNCAAPVCAWSPAGDTAPRPGYPVSWGARARRAAGSGTGDVYDAWTGELRANFFERPLRGMLVAGDVPALPLAGGESLSDFRAPAGPGPRGALVRSAVSNPRDDHTPLPDRRTAEFGGEAVAAGLVAGGAALLRAERPDLEPWALREALLDSARGSGGGRQLDLPEALDRVGALPPGSCLRPEQRVQRAQGRNRPWWKRVNVRVSLKPRGDPAPPASPEELD